MNQSKLILFFAALLAVTAARADVETTDKIVISELQVEPGSGSVYNFTVSLDGSDTHYTAFEIDLTLPHGLSVATTSKGDLRVSMVKPSLYPYEIEEQEDENGDIEEVKTYTHQLSKAMTGQNTLKVIVLSLENELFTKTSGDLFKVYVQASPYLKPGDAEIGISAKLVTIDEEKHIPTAYVSKSVNASNTSTLTMKVSEENKFATCILPFEYELPVDGSLKAYTCNACTSEAMLLTIVQGKMEAYTPYIIYASTGYSATVSGTVDAMKYPDEGFVQQGYLVGTLVQKELTEQTSYIMQNQGSGAMFYHVGATPFVINEGKCYAEFPSGANARSLIMNDEATDIEGVISTGSEPTIIYNLNGQRVYKMQHNSIYIVDGKKVINK